jgi:ATP adenylyltransferase
MSGLATRFVPGTLWDIIRQRSQKALAHGAVNPIKTRQIILPDGGVDFLVRVVSSLAQKRDYQRNIESKPQAGVDNPFLPYEPDLFVCDVSQRHLCLLNKFNVIENHVLLVTRVFEHQENLLTEMDFEAWFSCLREFNSLAFYNGGKVAGASQTHKHMQLIPLPLSKQGPEFPLLGLLQTAKYQSIHNTGNVAQVMRGNLAFRHGIIALDAQQMQNTLSAPSYLYNSYRQLLSAVGIEGVQVGGDVRQSAAYNLLISKQWMWMVPRSNEYYQGISVNALGFAGSLFVRDSAQLELVRNIGPMALLRSVSAYPQTYNFPR